MTAATSQNDSISESHIRDLARAAWAVYSEDPAQPPGVTINMASPCPTSTK